MYFDFENKNKIGKIIIKDLDLDLLNEVKQKEINKEHIDKLIENLIIEKVEPQLAKINEYENVLKVELIVKTNKNNFGVKIILEIMDNEFRTHFFKFDVEIETKDT